MACLNHCHQVQCPYTVLCIVHPPWSETGSPHSLPLREILWTQAIPAAIKSDIRQRWRHDGAELQSGRAAASVSAATESSGPTVSSSHLDNVCVAFVGLCSTYFVWLNFFWSPKQILLALHDCLGLILTPWLFCWCSNEFVNGVIEKKNMKA